MINEAQQSFYRRPEHNCQQQSAGNQDWNKGGDRELKLDRPGQRGDAEIGTQRVERAASEIDDLLDTEDNLQPGGDQKENGGVEYAADQDIEARQQIVDLLLALAHASVPIPKFARPRGSSNANFGIKGTLATL